MAIPAAMKGQKGGKKRDAPPDVVKRIHAERERDAQERGKRNAKYTDAKAPLDTGTLKSPDRFAGKDGHRELFVIQLEDGSTSEQWLAVPKDSRRCTANIRKGPYRGYRCRHPKLRGANVCQVHGGNLPHVREAARSRLLAYSDDAVKELIDIARDRTEASADRIRALNSILDRAGVDGKTTVTLEIAPWQAALAGIEEAVSGAKKGKKKPKKSKEA